MLIFLPTENVFGQYQHVGLFLIQSCFTERTNNWKYILLTKASVLRLLRSSYLLKNNQFETFVDSYLQPSQLISFFLSWMSHY